ncbi:MAG: hypothetical protein ACRENE_32700, partial [Polyangiaceae bacterium]
IPRIAVEALPTDDLEASGRVVASASLLAARSVKVHCRGLEARGELVHRNDSSEWAVWLGTEIGQAAAHRAGGSTDVTLTDAARWFDEQVERMRAQGL